VLIQHQTSRFIVDRRRKADRSAIRWQPFQNRQFAACRLASDDWPLLLKVVSSAFASVSLFVDHSDLNARAQPTDKL